MMRAQQKAATILFVAVLILGGWAWSQDGPQNSPSDRPPAATEPDTGESAPANVAPETATGEPEPTEPEPTEPDTADSEGADSENAVPAAVEPAATGPEAALPISTELAETIEKPRRQGVLTNLTIFVLAVFLGIEVISKVPPTLHTPLMSGSNAISGIALVGAVIVAAAVVQELSTAAGVFARFLGFIAVTLAMINAVGGFMVTHRMLSMFTRK